MSHRYGEYEQVNGATVNAEMDRADRLEAEVERLNAEVLVWINHSTLIAHKVITCGVAATHSNPKLTETGVYKEKWDSPQAESVRLLRAERDHAWAELRSIREAIKANPDESTLDEVERIYAKTQAGYQWNSVKDSLPDMKQEGNWIKSERCIIIVDLPSGKYEAFGQLTDILNTGLVWRVENHGGNWNAWVTHWAPMPKLAEVKLCSNT